MSLQGALWGASDAEVARVARRFCAAHLAAEDGYTGPTVAAMAERELALADLLSVCGFADPWGEDDGGYPERQIRHVVPRDGLL